MIPNKPIVFYAVSFYISCISYVVFDSNSLLGAVTAASFLIIILLTVDKRFSVIIGGFFIAGVVAIHAYYSFAAMDKLETIRISKIKDYYSVGSAKGRNIIIKGNLEGLEEGDKVLAKGKFEKQADYNRGTIGSFYVEDFRLYKPDMVSRLQTVKRNAYEKFEEHLGKEKAALVMSMCFGETAYLSEEQKYDFQELGVVHAISVSGFHMAVIYKILEGVMGLWPSILVSLLYMIFTGAQSATLRAFLMILTLKLSKKFFRNYDSLSALSTSALIILVFRPYYVLDVGFILSYLATLGIILYYNKIRRALFKLPKIINESLSLTLSAQTFSMAYSGMVFNNISFGFLLGNIVLLPMYTVLVAAGNMALLLLKTNYIFGLVCRGINFISTAIEGASYLLLKLVPPVADISYLSSLALLIIIACFILSKKGFEKCKFVPIFVLGIVMLENYNFFPRIDYLNLAGKDGIILSYKDERVLVHNLNEPISEKDKLKFSKVIENTGGEFVIRLGKNYSVKLINSKGYNSKSVDLEVVGHNRKTVLTRNTENFMDMDLKKYDIIKMPKQEYYPFKGKLTNKIPKDSYTVVFTKVYALHKD